MSFRRLRVLAAVVVILAPTSAMAHVLMTSPPPRNDRDDLKPPTYPGPCGNVPRTKKFTQYEVGQTIEVKFTETIAHTGCYQVAFSEANDQDFRVLAQMVDPAGGKDASYTLQVKLPDGVSCEACTLQLRQQMSGTAECPADAAEPPVEATYYSCADIRVGDFPDAAPSEDDDEGGGTSSGGPSTVPTDGGGKTGSNSGGSRRLQAVDAGDGGCNVGWGGASGLSALGSAGVAALLLARRRRRQRSAAR